MPREDVLGGLKAALERGESLKRAMISFYNAGYKKEEIEEAARSLLQEQRTIFPQTLEPKQTEIIQAKKEGEIQKTQQIVSSYETTEKKSNNITFILLIIILFVLLFLLIGVFVFKDSVIEFFNNML